MIALSHRAWVCLLYHDIVSDAVSGKGADDWFGVSAMTLGRHLDLLRDEGYAGCTVAGAVEKGGKCVAITFDDGVRTHYEQAFPALVERNMAGTFYVITDRVGTDGYVTWSELREMRGAGMSVQSHTRTHPFLSELNAQALQKELMSSKAKLDDELGQATMELALPGGDAPRRRLRGLLEDAGYRIVATSRWGTNHLQNPGAVTFVRRCTLAGDHGPDYLRRVVTGDRLLSFRRRVRERVLGSIRATLGPSHYASWRRRVLDRTLML